MSLLIKALNKAEETQAQNAKIEQTQLANAEANKLKQQRISTKQTPAVALENAGDMVLSLSPAKRIIDEPSLVDALLADAGVVQSGATLSASPKNASNVFTAKGKAQGNSNKSLATIAGLALFALLGMGAYFAQFIDNTPETAMPARAIASQATASQPSALQPTPPPAASETIVAAAPAPVVDNSMVEPLKPSAKTPEETTALEPRRINQKQLAETQLIEARITSQKRASKKSAPAFNDDEILENAGNAIGTENDAEAIEADTPIIARKKTGKAKTSKLGKIIASESASISVTKSQAQPGVNPTLMSAYEAYIDGKDSQAQKLYKQVLQRDVHNVDALLGMGAIAQRQAARMTPSAGSARC